MRLNYFLKRNQGLLMDVKQQKRRQSLKSIKAKEFHQGNLFGDGVCTVCGEEVKPVYCEGKPLIMQWCSVDCIWTYSSQWMTDKQITFVQEYLIDLNATQAAIRAGYSAKTACAIGTENLAKPVIKHAITLLMSMRSQRMKITADEVLADIEKIKQDAMRSMKGMMINHQAGLKACELQGRHLQMFVDKVEHSGTQTLHVITGVDAAD